MLKNKLKQRKEDSNKNKIENIVFLIIGLIIIVIIINMILKDDSNLNNNSEIDSSKVLVDDDNISNDNLEEKLEKILSTIKGVGDVCVFINYSESNQIIAMYDETTTTNSTEETDSAGGKRDTTSTEIQKEVVYSDENGLKNPVTEKVIMPVIEGAIITATGANNSVVKTNIINAIEAATGLSVDKIQVFEKTSN